MPHSGKVPVVIPEETSAGGCPLAGDSNLNVVTRQESGCGNFGVYQVHFEPAPTVAGSVHSRSTTASSRAARAALDLQRLEEERRLEKEFLAKKYEILQAQLEQEEDGSARSRRSRRSSQRTQEWVQSQVAPTKSITTESSQILVGTQSRTGTIPKVPVVPASCSATAGMESECERNKQPTYTRIGQVASNMQQSAASPSITASKDMYSISVNSVNACGGAVGGFSTISLDQNADSAAVDVSTSPTRTPESLTKELYELQKRVDELQQQLTSERTQRSQQQIQQSQTSGQGFRMPQIPETQSVVSFGQTRSLAMPARNPSYEMPLRRCITTVVSSVSQSCSNTITNPTAALVNTSMSLMDSLPPIRPPDMTNKTPPRTTGPCLLPPFMPFVPVHPPLAHSTPPSVNTVSSHVSPVMSSMVPSSAPISAAPISAAPEIVPRQLFGSPNSQQLAARQVVPRELPAFSGDPVDWPLFLSCYQNSTEMCGYSQGENLMRLQRCLKGNALEAVRSYLMHPSSVQLIIDTLRTLYGRPELIINSLLSKVRATPPPKADHLETLITFGLACKNLCSHLQAGELHDHLSNPFTTSGVGQ